jgi:hypothetical protein
MFWKHQPLRCRSVLRLANEDLGNPFRQRQEKQCYPANNLQRSALPLEERNRFCGFEPQTQMSRGQPVAKSQ